VTLRYLQDFRSIDIQVAIIFHIKPHRKHDQLHAHDRTHHDRKCIDGGQYTFGDPQEDGAKGQWNT